FSYAAADVPEDLDPNYWVQLGQETLNRLLETDVVNAPAKNVIIFVGDGMGISTVTASRIYGGQLQGRRGEGSSLAFEYFPFTALVKTYSVDKQVTDSAASATALFCGSKTKFTMLGVSALANLSECDSLAGHEIDSFIKRAQDKGEATGLVTTTRVTHATPAALYTHSVHRDWENDVRVPKDAAHKCKDIARQLIEDAPGKNLNVILGGGLAQFKDKQTAGGKRGDGMNLIEDWKRSKENRKFVTNRDELLAVDTNTTDYLLGLFADDHMAYELHRQESSSKQPSLADMVTTAVKLLRRNENGFALMVEGGRIDHGHHENRAVLALRDAVEFSNAVAVAMNLTSPKETLVLVTADHSHAFTLNGYASRGNSILGSAGVSESDGLSYTTLSYANGPSTTKRKNGTDTESSDYQQAVLVPLKQETHGGEDVALYASGPMAHLVHGVLEQNVVAHIIEYAACLGDGTVRRSRCLESAAALFRPDFAVWAALAVFLLVFR
ncbi:unnamed protein product, partial [Ixodes hexagonus]